ncbi:periplasmic binding protein/LacI transcriptional regulator, partial [gut metagenome]
MKVIGFDSGSKQMTAVKDGVEYGFLSQNPYGMGYATVIAGIRADMGLENDVFINTGYQWIDSS